MVSEPPTVVSDESGTSQYNYDNEWVKFMSELSKNETTKELADFIGANQWNDRQKNKIVSYCRIVLGRGLGTTFLPYKMDMYILRDKKALADCDIPLGMLRVDITAEFNLLMSLVDLHFFIEAQKSSGGFFIKRMALQRIEIEKEDKKNTGLAGIKDRIFGT